jgi:GcrA cell cycle regulator
MSWTDERIDTLRQLWEQGLTAGQIAEKLGEGLTRNAVIGKAHRLGLKGRPSPVKAGAEAPAAAPAAAPAPAPAAAAAPPPPAAPAAAAPAPAAPAAAAAPAPAIELPKARTAPVRSAPVGGKPGGKTTLLDLSDKVCKWPIGHPDEADFHFCGKPSQPGFPYCGEHCAVAYQAQLPRRDRPRPMPPMMPGMRPR